MSSVLTSHARSHRLRTGIAFTATAAVLAAAAWMTPRRAVKAAPPRPPMVSDGSPLLSARMASSHLLAGDHEAYVAITMTAPQVTAPARAPASVAIVLDTSGSMDDDHRLADAKAAAYSLIDRLGPDDELALITYATSAELILPLARATDEQRGMARRAVASMTASGGTNISGGLGVGADALAAAHTSLRRIVLISDGEPTEGLGSGLQVDPRPLIAYAGRRAADGTSITSVGVGLTFREDIMAGIASAGRGNYYFVEQAGDLSAMFARELGRLGETVVVDGDLALTAGDGVEVLDAIGYTLVRDADGLRVPVTDLRRGEQRKVVVRVRVRTSASYQDILGVTWRFRTVGGAVEEQRAVAQAEITADPTAVERGRDRAAVELIEQARTAAALEQASAAFAAGDSLGAQEVLARRRADVQGAGAAMDPRAMNQLLEVTGEAERGFARAPAAAAPEGRRAMKSTSAASFELAH